MSSTVDDAKARCAGLGATLGGTGWRLPTYKELATLVDYGGGTIGLALTDLSTFPGTPPVAFWSATRFLNNPTFPVHILDFGSGEEGGSDQQQMAASRCVR
jgi:hypothetical protein